MTEPFRLGAREARARIEAGTLTPEALLASCLERIASCEPEVGAFAHLDPAAALAVSRRAGGGPLRGLPVGVKDIMDTIDMPTAYGSPIYEGHRPPRDAFVVAALRRAGAVIPGKTATTEFAGPHPAGTRNPHDRRFSPGGSSAGSAAAVAASMLPFALGTQTAGSVVRPAAFCGIVGLKPSFGLVDTTGVRPAAVSLDTVGVLARNVGDAAMLLAVLACDPALDVPADAAFAPRIGVCRTFEWDEASPSVRTALEEAAAICRRAGLHLRDLLLPPVFRTAGEAARTVLAVETARSTASEILHHGERVSAAMRAVVAFGEGVPAETLGEARRTLARGADALDAAMEEAGLDVLVTPSARDEAPEGLASTGDPMFNRIWTALGLPAITLPQTLGTKGMPIGLQIVGRRGADRRTIAAALFLERLLADRAPR